MLSMFASGLMSNCLFCLYLQVSMWPDSEILLFRRKLSEKLIRFRKYSSSVLGFFSNFKFFDTFRYFKTCANKSCYLFASFFNLKILVLSNYIKFDFGK